MRPSASSLLRAISERILRADSHTHPTATVLFVDDGDDRCHGATVPELADNDPRKWIYTEHSRAKHRILERYLGAWFNIVGAPRRGVPFPLLTILDGFAGRGAYTNGEPGSPPIIFVRAAAALDARPARVMLLCGDGNGDNASNLERVMHDLTHERIEVRVRHRNFEESATILAKWLAQHPGKSSATFVFADPFGFSGIPLDVIRSLLKHDHVEVLLTFMARDMGRFLELPNAEKPLTETFGGESWVRCIDAPDRGSALLLEYQTIVRPSIATFATPFRVSSDERRETLYYLIHLTNHPLGMRRMKEAMVKEAPDMTFWPITVRPPAQLEFDVEEQSPYPRLQALLLERFGGHHLTFEALLNEHYPEGVWVEPQYRAALLALEKDEESSIHITRNRTTPSGQAPRGLDLVDAVTFP